MDEPIPKTQAILDFIREEAYNQDPLWSPDFTLERTRIFKREYLGPGWIFIIVTMGRMHARQRMREGTIEEEAIMVLMLRDAIIKKITK